MRAVRTAGHFGGGEKMVRGADPTFDHKRQLRLNPRIPWRFLQQRPKFLGRQERIRRRLR
jgi:hypothetical protein